MSVWKTEKERGVRALIAERAWDSHVDFAKVFPFTYEGMRDEFPKLKDLNAQQIVDVLGTKGEFPQSFYDCWERGGKEFPSEDQWLLSEHALKPDAKLKEIDELAYNKALKIYED